MGRAIPLALSVCLCGVAPLDAQASRVIGNATRVVTGTQARAMVAPPSADRRAATVLRLPFVVKPLATGSATNPAPGPSPTPPTGNPTPNPAPAPAPAPPPAVFEPRFAIDHYGLLWVPAKHAFNGIVRISIVDTLHPHQLPQPLPNAPIVFRLSADGASINPDVATIKTSNEPESVSVSFAGALKVDSIRVHVDPLGLDAAVDIPVAVTEVPLDITFADTMPGFGLGRAEAAIALPGAGEGDSLLVHLTAGNGSVSPENVWIGFNRPGKAVFHSGGLGTGSLTAKAMGPGFGEARADVAYAWPIGFTVAALLGVLIGGLGTMAFRKLAWTRGNVVTAFVGGFVAGLLVSICGSLLGVRIGNFDPGTGGGLTLVFVLAMVGALLGSQAMRLVVPTGSAEAAAKG